MLAEDSAGQDGVFVLRPLATPQARPGAGQLRAQEILPDRTGFSYLDPWQLLKHALGLAKQLGNGFSLQYIYYDWPGKTAEAHRIELERFADLVGDELRFKAMTYQQVYKGLRDSGLAEDEYLDYLGKGISRYYTELLCFQPVPELRI